LPAMLVEVTSEAAFAVEVASLARSTRVASVRMEALILISHRFFRFRRCLWDSRLYHLELHSLLKRVARNAQSVRIVMVFKHGVNLARMQAVRVPKNAGLMRNVQSVWMRIV
jgi:hypothetical protein